MAEQSNESPDGRQSAPLKLNEPKVDTNAPWADDLLGRQAIADRLTNLVATQEAPLSISLHGHWGTGKTFMLKRWQVDLQGRGFKSIYFNAWEEDFRDDPLLAIIGQLSSHLAEDRFQEIVGLVAGSAMPLIRSNIASLWNRFSGLTTEFERDSTDKRVLIKEYVKQQSSKDTLKSELEKLSATVRMESSHPLIFIVDELDRCRPPFAIELLERVKHIFDVRNLVFVFGLNRDELGKSLQSIYGEIDSNVYLRRFFDFEFNLPEVNSRGFAQQMVDRFQLGQAFQEIANVARHRVHLNDYDSYRTILPGLWSALGLSLRDIDYGIRLLVLLTRNLQPGMFTHPFLLVVLIAMKFKKPNFIAL